MMDQRRTRAAPATMRSNRDRIALLLGLVLPLAIAAALIPFRSSFPETDSALVLVVAVVAVAVNGNRIAGSLASISAGVWFDFFLTSPYEHFTISSHSAIETDVLVYVVGFAVTEIAVQGRRQRAIAEEEERLLARVHDVASMVASGEQTHFVIMRVAGALTDLLALRDCRFDPDTSHHSRSRIDERGDVILAGRRWPTLAGREVELGVMSSGKQYGRFVLTPTPGLAIPLSHRRVAVLLANLAGASLAGSPNT